MKACSVGTKRGKGVTGCRAGAILFLLLVASHLTSIISYMPFYLGIPAESSNKCVHQRMAWSKQLKVIQASCFAVVCLAHVTVLGHLLQEINGELHVLLIFSPRGLPVIQQKLQEWCSQRHEQSPLLNINAETLKIVSVEGEFHWFLKCQETRGRNVSSTELGRNRWLSASHWASAKSRETV